MAVTIKGMEIPRNCKGCRLKLVWDFHDGDVQCYCMAVSGKNIPAEFSEGRPGWCPLEEVTEGELG